MNLSANLAIVCPLVCLPAVALTDAPLTLSELSALFKLLFGRFTSLCFKFASTSSCGLGVCDRRALRCWSVCRSRRSSSHRTRTWKSTRRCVPHSQSPQSFACTVSMCGNFSRSCDMGRSRPRVSQGPMQLSVVGPVCDARGQIIVLELFACRCTKATTVAACTW